MCSPSRLSRRRFAATLEITPYGTNWEPRWQIVPGAKRSFFTSPPPRPTLYLYQRGFSLFALSAASGGRLSRHVHAFPLSAGDRCVHSGAGAEAKLCAGAGESGHCILQPGALCRSCHLLPESSESEPGGITLCCIALVRLQQYELQRSVLFEILG
mgnify:CR=1 FL=1